MTLKIGFFFVVFISIWGTLLLYRIRMLEKGQKKIFRYMQDGFIALDNLGRGH